MQNYKEELDAMLDQQMEHRDVFVLEGESTGFDRLLYPSSF